MLLLVAFVLAAAFLYSGLFADEYAAFEAETALAEGSDADAATALEGGARDSGTSGVLFALMSGANPVVWSIFGECVARSAAPRSAGGGCCRVWGPLPPRRRAAGRLPPPPRESAAGQPTRAKRTHARRATRARSS
jgi:hypothetical protein